MVASSSWRRGALSVDMSFRSCGGLGCTASPGAVTVQRRRMSESTVAQCTALFTTRIRAASSFLAQGVAEGRRPRAHRLAEVGVLVVGQVGWLMASEASLKAHERVATGSM